MKRAVLELASSRPIWSVPPETTAAIRAAFGDGWRVVDVRAETSSDGDGAGGSPEAVRAAAGAEVYMGWGIPRAVVQAAAGTLRWVHSAAAGVGGSLTPELRASGAVFTNSRGVHAEPIADWTLAAIAFCARGFHAASDARQRRDWAKDAFTDGRVKVHELRDLRVGVVGLGGIGEAVARRCAALGMEVRAVRRRPETPPPAGVSWVGGAADLVSLAESSDVLVIAVPQTAETERVIDDAVLGALPAGAYLVNVARGRLLDEDAVLAQLESGRLGGCVLDVVASEPLAPDHPFWTHPKVFVTPHVSGVSTRFWDRETALIVDNIRRYVEGRALTNIVDFALGY